MGYQTTQGFFLSVPERALRSGLFKNQQKPVAGKTNNDPWSSSLRSSVQLATGIVMGLMVLKPVGAIASTPVHSMPLSAANFSAIENNATGHYHLTENICFGNAAFCSQYPDAGVSNATLPFFSDQELNSNPINLFRGTLDGRGHSITGIRNDRANSGSPFIRFADRARIENITIYDSSGYSSVLLGKGFNRIKVDAIFNNLDNQLIVDSGYPGSLSGVLLYELTGNDTQLNMQGSGINMVSQVGTVVSKSTSLVVGRLTAANRNCVHQNNITNSHLVIKDSKNNGGFGIGDIISGINNTMNQNNMSHSSITLEYPSIITDTNGVLIIGIGVGIGAISNAGQIDLTQFNFNNLTINATYPTSNDEGNAVGIGVSYSSFFQTIKQQALSTMIASNAKYIAQVIGYVIGSSKNNIYIMNNNGRIIAKNGAKYVSASCNYDSNNRNNPTYLFSGRLIVEDQGANLETNTVGLVNTNIADTAAQISPYSTSIHCIKNGFVDHNGFMMRWNNGTAIEHPGSCVEIYSNFTYSYPVNPVYHTAQNATQWHLAHDVLNTKAQNCPNDRLGTYVNEIPQTLFMNQHQQMGLITRQTYPFTADREEENGVRGAADRQGIYIVHWAEPIVDSTDNGLSKTSNSIWYEPESLDQAVPVTAVYTDHVVDGDHLSMLFNNGTETLVSTFPLEQGATQGVYNTTSIPITGEAITINQNSLLSKANDTLFYYKKANDYAIATEYRFNQTDTQLLAATETGDSVFIAGVTGANHTLVIEKYLKDTEQRDTAFGTVEITQDLPINPNGSYHLVLENGQLHLKEKVLLLQSQGENSTGIAASTKPEGGCGSYHTHPVNVYDVTNTNPVEPEPSSTEYNLASSTDLLSGSSSNIGASGGPILTSTPIIPGIPTEDNDLTPVYIGLSVTVGAITVAALTITGVVLYKVVKNRMGAYDMRGVINAKAMEMQPAKH